LLTLNPAASGGVLAWYDWLNGQVALVFVILGVIALVISSIGAYQIIMPHSWGAAAAILLALAMFPFVMLYQVVSIVVAFFPIFVFYEPAILASRRKWCAFRKSCALMCGLV
jgi:hypothetical protein